MHNPAATADYLMVQLSTDGGSTYISTGYSDATGSVTNGLVITYFNDSATDLNNTQIWLSNMTVAAGYVTAWGADVGWDSVAMALAGGPQPAAYTVADITVNAFQLVTSDGTAFSGVFSLYAYRQ